MRTHTIGLATLCVFLLSTRALALDINRPASIRYVVRDEDQHPVAGVKITLTNRSVDTSPASAITDDKGVAQFQRRDPSDLDITWYENAAVEKDGFIANDAGIAAFRGAQLEKDVLLQKAQTTTITVHGPQGEPAVGVPVLISFNNWWTLTNRSRIPDPSGAIRRTDAKGQYQWVHAPLPARFNVTVASQQQSLPADADQVMFTLTADQMQRFATPRTLAGKLVLPDGKPAVNWLVGTDVYRDNSGGIIGGIAIPDNAYRVVRWQRIGTSGGFTSETPGTRIVVLSPEGLPSVYTLNPESWPAGVHAVTLTTPAISRTITGQLVDEVSGNPLSGALIRPGGMEGHGRLWFISSPTDEPPGSVLNSPAGVVQRGLIRADANGNFAFPVYSGMRLNAYSVSDNTPNTRWTILGTLGNKPQISVRPEYVASKPKVEDLKDITLVFVDKAGNRIDGPDMEQWSIAPPQDQLTASGRTAFDTRGLHYFVDQHATNMGFVSAEGIWKSVSQFNSLKGTADQTVEFKLDDTQHNKPVHGRVLDAAGNAAPGIQITAFNEWAAQYPPNTTTHQAYNDVVTTTDAQGNFDMAGAPDYCQIEAVDPLDTDAERFAFPLVKPVAVTPDKRNVEFHIPPAGTVRILLPPAYPFKYNWLLEADQPADKGIVTAYEAIPNASDHSLVATIVREGAYHIDTRDLPEFSDLATTHIEVTGNKTTTIDLRNHSVPASITSPTTKPALVWAALTITADGKPAPGAEVGVFQDPITPATTQPARYGFPEEPDPNTVTLDLADNAGVIRFQLDPTAQFIAAARIRGQRAGTLVFQPATAAAKNFAFTLDMKPTRDLIVKRAPNGPRPDGVSITKPDGLERDALLRLLAYDDLWIGPTGGTRDSIVGYTYEDTSAGLFFDAIPIGTVCAIQLSPNYDIRKPSAPSAPITIQPGPGPQIVTLDAPAP